MAELIIHIDKIKNNIKLLSEYFHQHKIQWSLVTKVFSGDVTFLQHILTPDIIKRINSIGDSRLTSLKNLKTVNPDIKTIYIKPPSKTYAAEVVKYADISLNSSLSTILSLNAAAKKAGKIHEIIIMIELGELREGIHTNNFMGFYEKVFELSNIEVIGIGSNLGCMYGIEPSYEKLQQLSTLKTLIARKFNKEIPLISGGSSITLPLIESHDVPEDINHFRIGEAVFFGKSPLNNLPFRNLETETFEFKANIIELEYKKMVPVGNMSDAGIGETMDVDRKNIGKHSYKAILDFGILDVDKKDIESVDDSLSFVGVTSDMLVVDLGKNKTIEGAKKYFVGDKMKFIPNYMAVARLLNSKFIDKKFVNGIS